METPLGISDSESSLRRINRMFHMLFESERVLARSTREPELLDGICRLLVDAGGYRLAWIGAARSDGGSNIEPLACAGFDLEYPHGPLAGWDGSEFGHGPAGWALRSDRPSIIRDIHNDERYLSLRAQAQRRGYASSIALPLKAQTNRYVLNIYSTDPDAFDSTEVDLLKRLASELAYGLASVWQQHQQRCIQDELDAAVRDRLHIIETIPDLLYKIDGDGRLQLWNRRVEIVTGYSAAELQGRQATRFFAPPERGRVAAAIMTTLDTGYAELEADLMTRDGRTIPYHFATSVLRGADGQVVGLTGIGHDLSERRRIEAERIHLLSQLQQAQKMDLFGQLAGGIAHDFNNILVAMLGYTELALERIDGKADPLLAGYMGEIARAGERARNLISQMLSFSRQSGGEVRSTVEMAGLVDELLLMLHPLLPATIEISSHAVSSPDHHVMANPTQLQQVIMNLCLNARDAMNGTGRIAISTERVVLNGQCCASCHRPVAGEFVALTIADTGSGIAPEIQGRIFEPFFTTKGPGKGTGMGLAMVHGIIHEHHGHITMASEAGRGSSFRILLPVMQAGAAAEEGVAASAADDALAGNGQRIMVVDDDDAVLAFVESYLQMHGFEVVSFLSSVSALAYFEANQEQIDLVISDQTMPAMAGAELARRILAQRPGLPVILITGYSEEICAERARAMGIARLLKKPFSIKELLSALEESFEYSRVPPEGGLGGEGHQADFTPLPGSTPPAP